MKAIQILSLKHFIFVNFVVLFLLYPRFGNGQKSVITEEQKILKTYPYSDPSPVPIVSDNPKIYPYNKFEGYSLQGREESWKIIRLENDYIIVWVLPEAGGKIWGAVDKSTGKEFIYRNEVMKFRRIAMRGPWTSGGIEFNFGIIGHSPSTASKVDYLIHENEDGSVSCFVGNLDLPSRTQWRVEVRLPADKAYFETNVQWFNPTSLNQSYYNWMTGAAAATEDLEFYCPGNLYLKHSGEPKTWHVDAEGRKISVYKNNNFGPSKSYHVVGSYEDFFGGYYHNSHFGFGHWSPYEEMPGQKLWLWALSRSGGIWEDLLTDTDGQYIEFQAGRLFDQYSETDHINPIRQVGFSPHSSDHWKEIWFPFKDINGMESASPYGVLNVTDNNDNLSIGINALQDLNDTLYIKVGNTITSKELLKMKPMEVFTKSISKKQSGDFEIIVGDKKLYYTSRQDSLIIKRPFEVSKEYYVSNDQQLVNEGIDAMNFRDYKKALEKFEQLLTKDPSRREALLACSELHFRKGEYDKSLHFSTQALMQNTYDAKANYLSGIVFRQKEDLVNALESFGWAARSMEYRSAAYAQMAEVYIRLGENEKAINYAQKSLDFNRYNINAQAVKIIANRLIGNETEDLISKLQEIDPLNHLSRYEDYVLERSDEKKSSFKKHITNEFPEETYLELALFYYSLGLNKDAIEVLSVGPSIVKNNLWMAYLNRIDNPGLSMDLLSKSIASSAEFVFPYRLESLDMLEWARKEQPSWKLDYFLGIAYEGVGRSDEAAELLISLKEQPDFWVFYLTRANLLGEASLEQQKSDLHKAKELEPESWRTWNQLIQFYLANKEYDIAADLSKKAVREFPNNYSLEFLYAKALLKVGGYQQCINILKDIQILPFEGARESRMIYEEAHIQLALKLIQKKKYTASVKLLHDALEWPENIGVGKPFDPEQRKQEFLLAYCNQKLDKNTRADSYFDSIIAYTQQTIDRPSPDHYLGLMALKLTSNETEAKDLLTKINNRMEFDSNYKIWITDIFRSEGNDYSTQNSDENDYKLIARIANIFKK